ncbi:MAG: type IVB secretion system protein IcmM/DotJ [bacterium]|nr:type IVB secretion system protein IcmM/DotJ [bacterium]
MSKETWSLIKLNKNFNVHVYRRGLSMLIVSLLLSAIVGALMFYEYLKLPERDYYATSGITSPVQLTSMLAPNMTSKPLLDPDPPLDDGNRVIPQ